MKDTLLSAHFLIALSLILLMAGDLFINKKVQPEVSGAVMLAVGYFFGKEQQKSDKDQ